MLRARQDRAKFCSGWTHVECAPPTGSWLLPLGAPPAGETALVLGHEASRRSMTPGEGVTTLSPGGWVVPTLRRTCPALCPACTAGRFDLCATGNYLERGIVRAHGYFTEFAVDQAVNLVAIPRSLVETAILAEPLSVVEKAIATALAAHPFQPRTALVTGCGPVGLLTAFALLVRGFEVEIASLEAADEARPGIALRAGGRYVRLPIRPRPPTWCSRPPVAGCRSARHSSPAYRRSARLHRLFRIPHSAYLSRGTAPESDDRSYRQCRRDSLSGGARRSGPLPANLAATDSSSADRSTSGANRWQ